MRTSTPPDAGRSTPPATALLALLPLGGSLLALPAALGHRLGAPATAALLGVDLLLVAVVAGLVLTKAGPAAAEIHARQARRRRDDAVLDALEPLRAARREGGRR